MGIEMAKRKICMINQRYGLEVNGGSELYTRQIAEHLTQKYDVEILTSCSLEYVRWSNHYKPGTEVINGVTVRRFKTLHERDPKTFSALDESMHRNPKAGKEESDRWIEGMGPYCPQLVDYVEEHQDDYDVIFVVTYLYYPAVKSLPRIGHKAVFIPTAHQEPYINFEMYRDVFHSAKAFIYLTDEEKELVHSIFDVRDVPCEVCGAGVDVPSVIDPDAFRKKYGLDEFIVYVGRIDLGKDCPRMFQYFQEYKKRNPGNLKLVLMGKAVVDIPKSKDIVSLGFVSDQDKFDGISASEALILPSRFESLSISVLEAMSLQRPVIVNGRCDVLKGHCVKSNGGFYYKNYFEFEAVLNYLLEHRDVSAAMGQNAKAYVDEYFQWDVIMDKFDGLIERMSETGKVESVVER